MPVVRLGEADLSFPGRTLSLTKHALSPTVTLVRNGSVNTACRTLVEQSSGYEDDQAALQAAENRSCLAQVMRSVTVGLDGCLPSGAATKITHLGHTHAHHACYCTYIS